MHHFFSKKFNAMLIHDDEGKPILMPCLFLKSLYKDTKVYVLTWSQKGTKQRIKESKLTPKSISKKKIDNYFYELNKFLIWLEQYSKDKKSISIANHHNLPSEVINYYLNDELVINKSKSFKMVELARCALQYYYNYLAYFGFSDLKFLDIEKNNLKYSRQNTKPRNAIKYLTSALRAKIYENAKNLRQECLLKLGAECGLRAGECTGILLNNFKIGNKVFKGVKSFFDTLDEEKNVSEEDHVQEFEYLLQGKFSKGSNGKGGKSRIIYISRDVMLRLKKYYEEERPAHESDCLFLTNSKNGVIGPIKHYQATRDFEDVRDIVIEKQNLGLFPDNLDRLETDHTYHILRHSFGTDKFCEACDKAGMRVEDVTYMSQPYCSVAELLGHSTCGQYGPKTTAKYIHSAQLKLAYEKSLRNVS